MIFYKKLTEKVDGNTKKVTRHFDLNIQMNNVYITSDVYQKIKKLGIRTWQLTKRTQWQVHSWWFELLRNIKEHGVNADFGNTAEVAYTTALQNYANLMYEFDVKGVEVDPILLDELKREKEEIERCLTPLTSHEERLLRPFLKSGFIYIGRHTSVSGVTREVSMVKPFEESMIVKTFGLVGLHDKMVLSLVDTIQVPYEATNKLIDKIDAKYEKGEL